MAEVRISIDSYDGNIEITENDHIGGGMGQPDRLARLLGDAVNRAINAAATRELRDDMAWKVVDRLGLNIQR